MDIINGVLVGPADINSAERSIFQNLSATMRLYYNRSFSALAYILDI